MNKIKKCRPASFMTLGQTRESKISPITLQEKNLRRALILCFTVENKPSCLSRLENYPITKEFQCISKRKRS